MTSTPDLAVATRELRAARAIVLDPTCDDDLAAGHLLRAWQALARAAGRDLADPAALLSHADRAAMPPRAVVEVTDVVPALLAAAADPPPPWPLSHAVMERHCDGLALLLATRHTPPATPRRRIARRVAIAAAALAAIVIAVRPWQSQAVGPWAATYFNRPDLTGAKFERRDLDVNFEWQDNPPMDAIPADRFSVRWDACLTLDNPQEVAFQLISDDGSRLYIDGKLHVDNWGRHELKARGRAVKLRAGVHHLRVEYFEHRSAAAIGLSASFGGDRPAPIPRAMLHAPPGSELDANPCRPG